MVQRSERKWRRLYRLAGDAPDNFVTLGQTVRGMRENTGLNVKSRHETGGLRFVMSRLPRLTVPGYPHHVIQRGNNRQPIVVDDADRQRLLDDLAEHARAHGVAVHAYVLMSNHLHLLVTPEAGDSLPGLGRIETIRRQDGRWVVVTSRGLIVSRCVRHSIRLRRRSSGACLQQKTDKKRHYQSCTHTNFSFLYKITIFREIPHP